MGPSGCSCLSMCFRIRRETNPRQPPPSNERTQKPLPGERLRRSSDAGHQWFSDDAQSFRVPNPTFHRRACRVLRRASRRKGLEGALKEGATFRCYSVKNRGFRNMGTLCYIARDQYMPEVEIMERTVGSTIARACPKSSNLSVINVACCLSPPGKLMSEISTMNSQAEELRMSPLAVTNGEVDSGEEDGTWRESGSEVQGPSRRAWCDDIRTRVLRVEHTDNVNYQCNAAYGERRGFRTLFCERDGVWFHIYTSGSHRLSERCRRQDGLL
jgi:hypothetical protein